MPQDIGDVLHGRTIAEQPACDTVAKHVRIGSMPSTSSEGSDHRVLGDACLDGHVIRRDVADENRTAVGRRMTPVSRQSEPATKARSPLRSAA